MCDCDEGHRKKKYTNEYHHPGNKKMAKNDVNYTILMKILAEKHDDWNEKNAIFDRETDIIFHVF